MNRWLAAVGSSADPLPDRWLEERPGLLRLWPVLGGREPSGIRRGELLLYYAATHQKLIAVARASENFVPGSPELAVQVLLAIPTIGLSPDCDWQALQMPSKAIAGWRAIRLEDDAYSTAWDAIVRRTRPS
jgi:hypothetical protein